MQVSTGFASTMNGKKSPPRRRSSRKNTKQKLLLAAQQEFCEAGYLGTDSNKIAKRAGFAPQTFYRWFESKTDVFLTVYRQWVDREFGDLGALLEQKASMRQLIDAALESHREFRIFRRSLRYLSLTEPAVRRARAESRLKQVNRIVRWTGGASTPDQIAALLLQLERLNDAVAEDELADMGMDDGALRSELATLYTRLGITS